MHTAGIHSSSGYTDVCGGHRVKQIGNQCHFKQMLRNLAGSGKREMKAISWGIWAPPAVPLQQVLWKVEAWAAFFILPSLPWNLPWPCQGAQADWEPFPLAPGVPRLLSVAGQEPCSLVPSTLLASAPAPQDTAGSEDRPCRRWAARCPASLGSQQSVNVQCSALDRHATADSQPSSNT